jgi:hypothetical protein
MPAHQHQHQHNGHQERSDSPAGSGGCTAPASCAPSMVIAVTEMRSVTPERVELPQLATTAPSSRRAAPDTPPPRV